MKNVFKLGLGSALKRIFGKEQNATRQPVITGSVKISQQPFETVADTETPETKTPDTITIWTIERSRYTAARAISTQVEVYPSEAVPLCDDIVCYVLTTPNGETVIVEARTGGLVGHSIEVVIDGIRDMTKVQLNNQLDTAKKEFNRMKKQEMSIDEFWQAIKMGGSDIDVVQDYQE